MNKISIADYFYLWKKWCSIHREFGVFPSYTALMSVKYFFPMVAQFARILRAYSSKGRFYHTLVHIRDCLKFVDQHYADRQGLYYVEMAIFFHDIVYDVKRKDNEAVSAELARKYCLRFGKNFTEIVDRLIMLTAGHSVADESNYLDKIMNDADMHVLGRNWEAYLDYARGVWREYAEFGQEAYTQGRVGFLKGLDGYSVFKTEEMKKNGWRIDRNLRREITYLRRNPSAIFG